MRIAAYRTRQGAERYARDLAAIFPKRRFQVVNHPHAFMWAVGVFSGDTRVAYAGKRKRRHAHVAHVARKLHGEETRP